MIIQKLQDMGLNVIPLNHKDSPDSKKPFFNWKEYQSKKYDKDFPFHHNIAVICGAISNNLLVLDLDDESLYNEFKEYHDRTFIVKTGKRGYHIYFRYDPNEFSTTIPKSKKLFDSQNREIDLKAEGGYVVAPTSIHPDTKKSYDIVADNPILRIRMEPLYEKLQKLGFVTKNNTMEDIENGVASGSRNDAMFKYACYLIRDKQLYDMPLRHELDTVNSKNTPPLPQSELNTIMESAMKYEGDKLKPPKKEYAEISLQEVTPEIEGTPMTFNATIIAAGERHTYTESADFTCSADEEHADFKGHCDQFFRMNPPKCPTCKSQGIIDYNSRVTKYIQQIRIQEFIEDSKNNSPVEFDAEILSDDVGKAFISDRKKFVGKFRSVPAKPYNMIVFEIQDMTDLDQKSGCMPTHEELEKWKSNPNIYDNVLSSIAPELFLRPELKETCMLSMAGGYSLNNKRSNIHSLFIGDAQLAKSELLCAINKIFVGSAYAVGKQASNAGLTIGMVKLFNGSLVPKAGLLPLHTGKVVCLDEVDKMTQGDRDGILECMEQQHCTLNKAGFPNTRLSANTTIIAAGNPKDGKFNPNNESILDNFNLEVPFITRFDIIWLLTDNKDTEEDMKIREHIRSYTKAKDIMSLEELQRFFSYVRTIVVNPVPQEIQERIDTFHIKLREESDLNELEVGWRLYYGLFRLVSASARLHLRDTATGEDLDIVERIVMASIESLKISGKVKMGSRKNANKDNTFASVWKKHADENNMVHRETFIKELAKHDTVFTRSSAEIMFNQWLQYGLIELNNLTGKYKYA